MTVSIGFIFAQTHNDNMKVKNEWFYGIDIYSYTNFQLEELLNSQKVKLDEEQSISYQRKIYIAKDNSLICDFDTHAFGFKNKEDFDKYIKKCEEIASKEHMNSFVFNIKDITKSDSIIQTFLDHYNLILKFEELENLKKVDSVLNADLKLGKDISVYSTALTLILGKFFKQIIPESNWYYYEDPISNNTVPVIMDKKLEMYNPLRIVDRELNYYIGKTGQVAFFDNAQIELIKSGVIKSMKTK